MPICFPFSCFFFLYFLILFRLSFLSVLSTHLFWPLNTEVLKTWLSIFFKLSHLARSLKPRPPITTSSQTTQISLSAKPCSCVSAFLHGSFQACPGISSDLASRLLLCSIHLGLPCSLPIPLVHFISRSCQPRPQPTSQVVPFSASTAVIHVLSAPPLPAFPREFPHGCPAAGSLCCGCSRIFRRQLCLRIPLLVSVNGFAPPGWRPQSLPGPAGLCRGGPLPGSGGFLCLSTSPTAGPPAWTHVPALSSSATSLHITAQSPLSQQALLPAWAGRPAWRHCIAFIAAVTQIMGSLVAQRRRAHLPAQDTQARSLGWEDPLEATHSSVLAWEVARTGEPGGLQSTGSQKSWTRLHDSNDSTDCTFKFLCDSFKSAASSLKHC